MRQKRSYLLLHVTYVAVLRVWARLRLRSCAGRSDLLERRIFDDGAYAHVDLSAILRLPEYDERERFLPEIHAHLDDLIGAQAVLPITPADRAVGARFAAQFSQRYRSGESKEQQYVRYRGTAGQSFGAFLSDGVHLTLDGDANDYVGKSMEAGSIVVLGHDRPHEPVIGNACFYGARGGRAFIHGTAGERFAVRNSGAQLVAEGAGDHACEYMTSGTVILLGPVGRNLASGMSGGKLFLFDVGEELKCGPTECGFQLGGATVEEEVELYLLLNEHVKHTGSERGKHILQEWPDVLNRFTRIAPVAVHEELRPANI